MRGWLPPVPPACRHLRLPGRRKSPRMPLRSEKKGLHSWIGIEVGRLNERQPASGGGPVVEYADVGEHPEGCSPTSAFLFELARRTTPMLVLSRKPGEKIHVGSGITITGVRVEGNRVRL